MLYLWREQNGLCPVGQQKITKLTGWHSHHMVRRVDGGIAMLSPYPISYGGAGPSQLALAILGHEFGDCIALDHWSRFEQRVLKQPDFHKPFDLPSEELSAFRSKKPLCIRKRWRFHLWPPSLSVTLMPAHLVSGDNDARSTDSSSGISNSRIA